VRGCFILTHVAGVICYLLFPQFSDKEGAKGNFNISIYSQNLPQYNNESEDNLDAILPMQKYNPLIISDGGNLKKCRLLKNKNLSPSEYEYEDFRNRLSINGDRVEISVNIRCVEKVFGKNNIDAWAKRGDPLAVYAFLDRRYRVTSEACRDAKYIEKTLIDASRVMNVRKFSGNPDSRMPELLYVAGLLRSRCNIPGSDQLLRESESIGFYPKNINNLVY
jgi:hypothetical protein